MQTNLSNFSSRRKTGAKKAPAKAPARKTAAKAPAKKAPAKRKPLKQSYDREKGDRSPKLSAKQRREILHPISYQSRTVRKGMEITSRTEKSKEYSTVDQRYARTAEGEKRLKEKDLARIIREENTLIGRASENYYHALRDAQKNGYKNRAATIEKATARLKAALDADKATDASRIRRKAMLKESRELFEKAQKMRN